MPWTAGNIHDVSGHGEVTIARPDALAIVVTNVPPRAGVRVGYPPTYWGVGHVAPGSSSGFLRDIPIRHVAQVETLPLREYTRLGYTLEPDVEITVTELHGGDSALKPMPWDRDPERVALGGSVSTTVNDYAAIAATYTVPANRILRLGPATCSFHKTQNGQGNNVNEIQGWVETAHVFRVICPALSAHGFYSLEVLSTPIELFAGETLDIWIAKYETDAGVSFDFRAAAYLFDA